MTSHLSVILVSVLLFAGAGFARADDQATVKEILAKAIKAHGGEERLNKIKSATWKETGKYFGAEAEGLEFKAETTFQGINKRKVDIVGELDGAPFRLIYAVNGDKGWQKLKDDVEDMEQEELDEQKEQTFSDWTAFINLASLRGDAFTLAPLGETKDEGRTLVGIRASSKGHRDLNLHFDKETGLLYKAEWQVKDLEGEAGGGEVKQETYLSDYKEFDGVKMATKTVVKWVGKTRVESVSSDFRFADKVDDSAFEKP